MFIFSIAIWAIFQTLLRAEVIVQSYFLNQTDVDPSIQLDNFGSSMMINHNHTFYDIVYCNSFALQARSFFKDFVQKYELVPKNPNFFKNSDLLSPIDFYDDSNQRKCSKCGKNFITNPSVHYHLQRDHIQFSTFQLAAEGNSEEYYFMDKLCKFIDCTREKNQHNTQTFIQSEKRVSHCFNFMLENFVKQENQTEDQFIKKVYQLCEYVGKKDPSEMIEATQSTFFSVLWTIIFWIGILMSISYYSILLLTQEGRRAWLTKIED
ncbi:transmembrane protein, putative (macronuclear) [Tetrahymena thermophila SB210]|uniref:Transmembrane protein, putative n=1 Tax=Tetrahymena thermophila (strain SB210) TaxID=312017 RepID=I7MEW4_TETTS|nr:transmembrane protein, putative [Tetrahymena thermophila SB210]EAR97925.1 transmembrane protein, putative [Tetrahymena thermophila SB210]|eukprot:XP_001018170.1 transmembrane protein, putative [Tetrahymena thermophila SB210]